MRSLRESLQADGHTMREVREFLERIYEQLELFKDEHPATYHYLTEITSPSENFFDQALMKLSLALDLLGEEGRQSRVWEWQEDGHAFDRDDSRDVNLRGIA
ncbi:hypothetical protein [Fischerella sp. PCC 9605]|uniref:hypothetical protein n=1 Tax=Fischerella sp. PCC 9605 TaxID=1173024 RepID=UPI00047BBB45|nr:hypothetical protein [Fischerella sp. PCC 9605]